MKKIKEGITRREFLKLATGTLAALATKVVLKDKPSLAEPIKETVESGPNPESVDSGLPVTMQDVSPDYLHNFRDGSIQLKDTGYISNQLTISEADIIAAGINPSDIAFIAVEYDMKVQGQIMQSADSFSYQPDANGVLQLTVQLYTPGSWVDPWINGLTGERTNEWLEVTPHRLQVYLIGGNSPMLLGFAGAQTQRYYREPYAPHVQYLTNTGNGITGNWGVNAANTAGMK